MIKENEHDETGKVPTNEQQLGQEIDKRHHVTDQCVTVMAIQ